MPAPLSIIIPTLNAAGDLPLCLESLVAGLESGLIREVIISDGGSEDATLEIAEAAGCTLIVATKGRGTQLATGATAARGDWLFFLHADTALSPDWVEATTRHIETNPNKAAAFKLVFRSDAKQARWLERRANARARRLGLPWGDQGLLISRALYDEVGGYADVPLMEDVMIVRVIGKKRLAFLSAEARTSAAKYERDGWHKRARSNAFLQARFLMGASPEKLAKRYT